jgi:hypothetical protein
MLVIVRGLATGARVSFKVLRDCDQDTVPDDSPGCPPVASLAPATTPVDGRIEWRLDFQGHPEIPAELPLVLRTTVTLAGGSASSDTSFALSSNRCSLWRNVVDLFLGGECRPDLAAGLAGPHWGESADTVFDGEILLAPVDAEPVRVAATSGATGFFFRDAHELVFTSLRPTPSMKEPDTTPGLFVIRDDGTSRRRLASTGDRVPVAPALLRSGEIAFFTLAAEGPDAASGTQLCTWSPAGVRSRPVTLARPYRVLGVAEAAQALLVMSYEAGKPMLFRVSLADGAVTRLGWEPLVYVEALRALDGESSLGEFESLAGSSKWDIGLIDSAGKVTRVPFNSTADERFPVWRPGGKDVGFLRR